jgi:putative nucleotidyltransferase with HDIG domain
LAAIIGVETFLRLKRSTIFKSALLMVVPVQILAATLLSVEKGDLTFTFFLTNSSLALTSAMLSAILASFFIPLLETGFKLITELKLIELTNLNLPVFRQMLEKAPGTYHHSQMVASLAESAALDLKISPLMLTAMALYHDIGKIDSPQYFTENHSVYASPHSNMTPLESARAIIAHVSRGVELAVKLKLPPEVASVITQHHGSKIVKYFYDKALEKRTNGDKSEIDASDFRYPGKKPQTIENAIIMLADQVEAASKSLSRPTDNEIRNVIDMVIAANIEDNQFIECQGLTFQTLGIISGSFYKKLSSIYHMRIAYPGFDFSSERTQTDGQAAD